MYQARVSLCLALCLLLVACAQTGVDAPRSQLPADHSAPAASTEPVVLPDALLHPWIGEEREIAGLSSPRDSALFEFLPDGPVLALRGTITSKVVRFDDTEFVLSLANAAAGCERGASGAYRWSLTPAGDLLTLEPIEDECAARSAALEGAWTRSDCPIPDNACLGPLEPGAHTSTFFNPLVRFEEWEYERGIMTYTVPAGWANTSDFPHKYRLQPQERSGEPGIFMWSEAGIVSDEHPCISATDPGFDRTPSSFVSWLQHHPDLDTTASRPVTIGGLAGSVVEAEVRADAELPCIGFGPYLPMLANDNDLQWGFEPRMRKRMYFLTLPGERTLIISIEANGRGLFEQLVGPATDIVESISIRRP